jgi:hypothetical protein
MKTTVSSDGVARRSGPTEWPDGVARRSGPMGWPDGVAGAQWRADGCPLGADGCPTEGTRAPDRGGMAARRRAHGRPIECARRRVGLGGWPNGGSRGWPDGGLYKSAWPTFLGTLLQRPVSPARNVGAQGANE